MKSTVLTFCTLIASYLPERPHRLDYLKKFEDDPSDEYIETLKSNYDGTSFVDDSYFLWLHNRYYWRKGADQFNPDINEVTLGDEGIVKLLEDLRNKKSLSTPLPLTTVVDDEWRIWQEDPDFPKQEVLDSYGIHELVMDGLRWKDGVSGNPDATSMSTDDDTSLNEESEHNPTVLDDAGSFGDLQ